MTPGNRRRRGTTCLHYHQPFQVPKITLVQAVLGVESLPYTSLNQTAYIGEDSSILGTWNSWWHYEVAPAQQQYDAKVI